MRGSIVFQVDTCITQIDKIGQSKRDFREKGIKAIHSRKTKSEVRKIARQFVKWAREHHGVKHMQELTEAHYRGFLDSKHDTTLDYRRSIETHLRLLQEGWRRYAERFGLESSTFVTETRLIGPRERMESVSDRSLEPDEIAELRAGVSENGCKALDLMHRMGLRVSGAVSVTAGDVDFRRGVVKVTEKGGRAREVPIPDDFKRRLVCMVEGREASDRLVPVQPGTISDDIKAAARKAGITGYTGTHAFRHTYARNRVDQLMTEQEKALFQSCLSRYEEGRKFDYGVHDRELYEAMKQKMDMVHAELGHGPNRFDLAVRYMR